MYFSSSPCQDPMVARICINEISPSHAVKLAAAANLIESLLSSQDFMLSGFVIFGDIKGKTWS